MNVAERDLFDVSQIINLFDVEKLAAERMTPMAYEYVASGAADGLRIRGQWSRR